MIKNFHIKNEYSDTTADSFYSESNMERLRASITELNSGRVIRKTIEELKELETE